MRVGVDLDGVCADYIGAIRQVGRDLGHEIADTPPSTYSMVCNGWFPSTEAWHQAHLEAMPNAADFAPLVSVAAFEPLKRTGAELVAITARDTTYFEETYAWIEKHLPGIFDRVAFTTDKHTYGLDVLIEDNPAEVGKGTPVVLVDYPYNRHVSPAYRTHSTAEALNLVANS